MMREYTSQCATWHDDPLAFKASPAQLLGVQVRPCAVLATLALGLTCP